MYIINTHSKNISHAGNQQGSLAEFNRDDPSETTRRISQEQALAILLGLLFTDGCVSPKKGSYRIYFANKHFALVGLFQQCMLNAFSMHSPNVLIGLTTDGLHRAIVNSKSIGSYLVETFGTFRTLRFTTGDLPNAHLPIQFLHKTASVNLFLQAAFSADGGICFYPAKRNGKRGGTTWLIRTVFLACAHLELRKNYMTLLRSLNIPAREVVKDGKIKIETQHGIQVFAGLIGFAKGSKVTSHSKYWDGRDKNEVLSFVLDSYNNPAKYYSLNLFER